MYKTFFEKKLQVTIRLCTLFQLINQPCTERFSTLSQGLEDAISESSIGQFCDIRATYCPFKPSQIVYESKTKPCD